MLCLSLVAAQQTSSGRVHDQPGLPVPEASVICPRDFAKRCLLSFRLNTGFQASLAGKITRGLAVLLGVSREPRPRPIHEWVAELFCVKTRGVGRGDFVTLIRVLCQKAVQSQRIFPVA